MTPVYCIDKGVHLSGLAKYGNSNIEIIFDKNKGATVQTELNADDTSFILSVIDASLGFVLEKARSGDTNANVPPRIAGDPLHISMTDAEFEEKVPKMFKAEDVAKIRKERKQTIAEMMWLQLTIQEIQAKNKPR